jgi:hypothetical protein
MSHTVQLHPDVQPDCALYHVHAAPRRSLAHIASTKQYFRDKLISSIFEMQILRRSAERVPRVASVVRERAQPLLIPHDAPLGAQTRL